MRPYFKSKLISNWSFGLLKISPFFNKIQGKNPQNSSRFLSVIAATLREPSDYSSGEEKQHVNSPKLTGNCSVVNTLNKLEGKPLGAFDYFRKSENEGFCHDLSSYSAIICILSNSGHKFKLVSVFCDLVCLNRDLSSQISSIFFSLAHRTKDPFAVSFALDALLKAFERCNRDPREAMDVLFHLRKLGFHPSIRSWNFLLKNVAKTHDLDALLRIFDFMREFGINPDLHSFTILIKFHCNARNPDGAFKVLDQMGEMGLEPDRLTYLTLLSGLCACEKYSTSYTLLQQLAKFGIRANSVDYNIVIKGLCKESKLQEADNLLESMEKQEIPQDEFAYGYIIKGHCENGNIVRALDLYEQMKSKRIDVVPCIASHLLQYFRKAGKNYEALCYFKYFKSNGLALDKVLYNFGIDIYCRLGFLEEAWELIQEMRSNGLKPDTIHYTCLIGGFCQKKEIDNAHKAFDEMLSDGLKPDLVTYNVLVSGYCRAGKVNDAFDLLDEMIKQGIEPNFITHGLVIEGFAKGKQLKEAIIWFNLQLENRSRNRTGHVTGQNHLYSSMVLGYLHGGRTYRAYELFSKFARQGGVINRGASAKLIRELCDEGNVNLASNVFDIMIKDYQVVPELLSYGKLIAACCDYRDIFAARFWFDDLSTRGLCADKYIYTTLMNGYCKVGNLDEACKLFNEMICIGIGPDVVAYTVLLDGHYKELFRQNWSQMSKEKKKTEIKARVLKLTNHMIESKTGPDVICYTVLIDGQCNLEYLDGAQKMFDYMLSQGLEPDVQVYTALINGHCSRGNIGKAQGLFQEMVDRGIRPDTLAFSVLDKALLRARDF